MAIDKDVYCRFDTTERKAIYKQHSDCICVL
jgi:hypothetical protein